MDVLIGSGPLQQRRKRQPTKWFIKMTFLMSWIRPLHCRQCNGVANETPFPFFIKTDERGGQKQINVKRCHKSVGGIADGVEGIADGEAEASRALALLAMQQPKRLQPLGPLALF